MAEHKTRHKTTRRKQTNASVHVEAVRRARNGKPTTEEALRESEARYRLLFESMQEAFFAAEIVTDVAGVPVNYRFLEVNPALERMTGLSHSNLLGRLATEALPGLGSQWIATFGRVALTGEPTRFEQYATPLGRWYEAYAYCPKRGQFATTFLDITERKRAEAELETLLEELNMQHARLRAILDSLPVGVWIVDAAGRMVEVNDCARDIWGGKAPQAQKVADYGVYKAWWADTGALITAEDMPLARAIRGETLKDRLINLERFDGLRGTILLSAAPVRDPEGKVAGGIAVGQDISKLKEAEEALRRSERRLEQGVRVAGLGTFEHDHVADEVEASPVLRELYGFGQDEPVTLASILERMFPEDRERAAAAIRQAHAPDGNGTYGIEHRITPGRDTRWVSVRSQTYFEGQGSLRRPVRTIGAVLDITEQKAFELELERLVKERTARLQELVGELEHFSYTITHDMRAPLRAMMGYGQVVSSICEKCANQEPREFLRRIMAATERMDALIRDALNYSRSVRQELPLDEVDTGALLRGMLDSYPELQPSRAHVRIEGQLPVVWGNEAGLTQCFSNLLGNAVKFVKPGETPEVRVWAEAVAGPASSAPDGHGPAQNWVRIWVEDKGIGIPKAMLPKVFDMFSRASSAYEGTGIGLALVRKVAQRMGGRTGVQSHEAKGSRFWLELRSARRPESSPL